MKKIKNKKAVSREFLIKLIIFIASIVVLIAFTAKETGIISFHSQKMNCKLSAIKSSQTGKTRLNCPRKIITIQENSIIENNDILKSGKITDDDIKKLFADNMADCWDKFGKGKLNVFESKWFFSELFGKNICEVCAEIHFEKIPEKEITGFKDYLKNNNVPKKYSDKEISYYEFMTKEQRDKYIVGQIPWTQWTPWGLSTDSIESSDKITTSKDYAVIYKEYVPEESNEIAKAENRAHYILLKSFSSLTKCCCDFIYE